MTKENTFTLKVIYVKVTQSSNNLATFVSEFVAKNFQKSPTLVTLNVNKSLMGIQYSTIIAAFFTMPASVPKICFELCL